MEQGQLHKAADKLTHSYKWQFARMAKIAIAGKSGRPGRLAYEPTN